MNPTIKKFLFIAGLIAFAGVVLYIVLVMSYSTNHPKQLFG